MHCMICDRIEQAKHQMNPYLVKELQTGYVVIGDHQYFKGYTIFICKEHVRELYDLKHEVMMTYLEELAMVSKAVSIAFQADKMNIESLGNGEAHLHFHLFPRKDGDTPIKGPVWWLPKEMMYDESNVIKGKALQKMKQQLLNALDALV